MNLSELKIFFKEKLGIEKLADIARELNVSPQAMNNWKSRDRIPDKITLKIQKSTYITTKILERVPISL